MAVALPTEKSPRTLSAATAKVLLYGPPKIGKTTLCVDLNADSTLILACEPGTGGVEAYELPIRSWDEYREACSMLSKGEHKFTTVAIDTVDELWKFCTATTMAEHKITHPSDLEWGKGWQAVSDKFRLGVGYLASLGLGVWFVSHSKDVEIKQPIGTKTVTVPTVGGGCRDFLLGFCDHIFFATQVTLEDGRQERVIRTTASLAYEAGSRLTLADPLPLTGEAVREALGG